MDCPKCGTEMEYAEYDPSVGFMEGGWICPECEEFVNEMDTDWED